MEDTGASVIPDSVGWMMFTGLWFVAGIACLGKGIRAVQNARRAASWPTTVGNLIHCELLETKPDGDPALWRVRVCYRYRIADRDYQGSEIAYGYDSSRSREEHQALFDKLRSAERIVVRYDPIRPETAVLSSSAGRQARNHQGFGGSFCLMACGIAGLVLHHGPKWSGIDLGPVDGICLAVVFIAFGAALRFGIATDSGRDDSLVDGIESFDASSQRVSA